MNEINTGMAELHQKVLNLQKDGLAPTKSTEAEVEKKPNFVDVAKEMFTSIKPVEIIEGVLERSLNQYSNFMAAVDKHPIAYSIASVPVGVATVFASAFLFR